MAAPLTQLQVFSEYMYDSYTETLTYNINLFNQATRGGFILTSGMNQGDFSDRAVWGALTGLVRRRDPYAEGPVTEKQLAQLLATSVKVGAGTPPVRLDNAMMRWIARDPAEAAAALATQLAEQTLADMLTVGMKAFINALINLGATVYKDGSAGNSSLSTLLATAGLFGDRSQDILCWVTHSKPMLDIWGDALTNKQLLFQFGNVRVMSDGFGRPFVVTDLPCLVDTTPNPDVYFTCGLAGNAVLIEQNNDYDDNIQSVNGDENIKKTFQAEWSYNVGLKGFRWDKANGGKAPDDTELATGTNWDKYATSIKDCAGVVLKSQ